MDEHLVASGSSFICVFPISDSCFLNVRDSLYDNNKKYIQFKYKDYVFHLSDHSFAVFLNALKNPSIKKTHLNTTTWLEKQPDGIVIKRFDTKTVISYDEARSVIEQSSQIQELLNSDQSLLVMASSMHYDNENQEDDSDCALSEPSDIDDCHEDDDNNDNIDKGHLEMLNGGDTKNDTDEGGDVHHVCNDTKSAHANHHPSHQNVDIIDLTSDDEDNDIVTSNESTKLNDTSQQTDEQKASGNNETDIHTSVCADNEQSQLSDDNTEPITDQCHDNDKSDDSNIAYPGLGKRKNTEQSTSHDYEPPKKVPKIVYYIDETVSPLVNDLMKPNDTQASNNTLTQGNTPNNSTPNQSTYVCEDYSQSSMMDNTQSALMGSDKAQPVLMDDKTVKAHDENARSSFDDTDDELENDNFTQNDLTIYDDIDKSHDLMIDLDTNSNMNDKV